MIQPIYLYVKTHNVTGLKYFGKTIKDPMTYAGSGKHWIRHLAVHGHDVSTVVYGCYTDVHEAKQAAIDFSLKNNIVESTSWANLRIECLDGGDTSKTQGYIDSLHKISESGKKKTLVE